MLAPSRCAVFLQICFAFRSFRECLDIRCITSAKKWGGARRFLQWSSGGNPVRPAAVLKLRLLAADAVKFGVAVDMVVDSDAEELHVVVTERPYFLLFFRRIGFFFGRFAHGVSFVELSLFFDADQHLLGGE